MVSILFLCHGNICRSPMGEFIMKDLVRREGVEKDFEISSAAVSDEEIGNPVYPPARKKLSEYGISAKGHAAHRVTPQEFDAADFVIVMDRYNLDWLEEIVGRNKMEDRSKVHMMMEFASFPPLSREEADNVADPWFTGDFETTFQDIVGGCRGLLKMLVRKCS